MKKNKKSIKRIAEEEKVKKENPTPPEEKDEDEEDKEKRGVSYILDDGSLVEMLYDKKKHKSQLAIYKGGTVTLEEKVKIGDSMWFRPLKANQGILETGFLSLPSEVGKYQSNEELYLEVRAFIERYVKLTDAFLTVVAVYVFTTWVYDKFHTVPYLRVTGLWGTGKTRVLDVVGRLCYKAIFAGGSSSTSALFRTLNFTNGTLVFDEAELSEKESTEMRQILRQGFSANSPVTRTERNNKGMFYTETFDVFGPKIMASQFKFNDAALESRCISEQMFPLKSGKPIELSLQFKQEALELRNKLLSFRFRNYAIVVVDEETLNEVHLPRLKQTGLAVGSVAKLFGRKALDDVISFLSDYEKVLHLEQADSVEHDILLCILNLMTEKEIQKSGKIRIGSNLASAFNFLKYEDYSTRETKEYNSSTQGVLKFPGQRVSPKKIGGYVRKLGLRVERDGGGFYIYVLTEYPKIQALARRYGLDSLYTLSEDPTKLKEVLTQEELNDRALQKEIEAEWEKNKNIST